MQMEQEGNVLKFPPPGDSQTTSPEKNPMESQLSAPPMTAPPSRRDSPPPIWMQRFFLVTTVIFCLWIGLVLSVLPWLPVWTENSLVSDFPNFRWLIGTGFIRGLATGIGLLDLWIGISEAVHYRDRR